MIRVAFERLLVIVAGLGPVGLGRGFVTALHEFRGGLVFEDVRVADAAGAVARGVAALREGGLEESGNRAQHNCSGRHGDGDSYAHRLTWRVRTYDAIEQPTNRHGSQEKQTNRLLYLSSSTVSRLGLVEITHFLASTV